MSGIAATLSHQRALRSGVGSAGQPVRYLGQDYGALQDEGLQLGRLFEDDAFPANVSSLGFKELGPSSYKVRGVTWSRPTVRPGPGPSGPGAALSSSRDPDLDTHLFIDLDLCRDLDTDLYIDLYKIR